MSEKRLQFDTMQQSVKMDFNVETKGPGFTKEISKFRYGTNTYFASYWKPTKAPPKALVYVCHGYAEYVGPNYEELAQYLCKRGNLVFGHDHVGHGRTTGKRVHINSIDDYVDPVIAHVKAVTNWPGNETLPIYLLGHSMGGLVALVVLFKQQKLFSGFIGIGPLVEVNAALATPFRKCLAKTLPTSTKTK